MYIVYIYNFSCYSISKKQIYYNLNIIIDRQINIFTNEGNIHFKNERYDEAIESYREAVQLVEKDLNSIYKANPFQQTLVIKKGGVDSGLMRARVNITKSRRRVDRKKDLKEQADIQKLETLYSNR